MNFASRINRHFLLSFRQYTSQLYIDDSHHYDRFVFPTLDELNDFRNRVDCLADRQSEWYGRLDQFQTITEDNRYVNTLLSNKHWRSNDLQKSYVGILPCYLAPPNFFVSVRSELLYSLLDWCDMIVNHPFWFKDQPTIFAYIRLSELYDHKPRQIFLHEFLDQTLRAALLLVPMKIKELSHVKSSEKTKSDPKSASLQLDIDYNSVMAEDPKARSASDGMLRHVEIDTDPRKVASSLEQLEKMANMDAYVYLVMHSLDARQSGLMYQADQVEHESVNVSEPERGKTTAMERERKTSMELSTSTAKTKPASFTIPIPDPVIIDLSPEHSANDDSSDQQNTSSTEESDVEQHTFVRLKMSILKLKKYERHLSGMDGILIDTIIHLNDRGMLLDSKTTMRWDLVPFKSVHGRRSLDVGCVVELIKIFIGESDISNSLLALELIEPGESMTHLPTLLKLENNGDDEIKPAGPSTLPSRLPSSVDVFEGLEDKVGMKRMVHHMINIVNEVGFSVEQPLKFVHSNKATSHIVRVPRHSLTSSMPIFHAFSRCVRSVSTDGYRVKSRSLILWITLIIALVIPFVYCILRAPYASLEDMLSTSISIVSLCVGAATTCVLNTVYRGEQLTDVLTNMRNIDTQEEFGDRAPVKQLTDIVQVLRKSRESPAFLGGGPNTSFIRAVSENLGFDAHLPMPFTNLQVIGFGLFEDQNGDLYMVDIWSNVFEVQVLYNPRRTPNSFPKRRGDNMYVESPEFAEFTDQNVGQTECERLSSMNLLCKQLNLTKEVTKYRIAVGSSAASSSSLLDEERGSLIGTHTDRSEDPLNWNTGCLSVGYMVEDAEKVVHLSRVLPYGFRERYVIVFGYRSFRNESMWMMISNKSLLQLSVGIGFLEKIND